MTDQDLMPFGIHRTKRMEHVPADYLLWLWDDGGAGGGLWNGARSEGARSVREYIVANFANL